MNLTKSQVLNLFNAAIDNSFEMMQAAHHLAFKYEDGKKYVCLGIAELALEELGKSYSLLAQYAKADQTTDWKQFWKDWRAHDVKAARGFFYEFFCTIRMELRNPNDPLLKDVIPRGKFSIEKEMAFYVDIDKQSKMIHDPSLNISDEEAISRTISLYGLLNPALQIKDWMNSTETERFKEAFSDYAYITLTENVYQQDMPLILGHLRNAEEDYNKGLNEIWKMFN